MRAQVAERPPALAVGVEVAVDHHRRRARGHASLARPGPQPESRSAEHVEDRQVVVELHARPAARRAARPPRRRRSRARSPAASGMPSARACSVVIPCTAVASTGISRPGSMRPDQLRTATPSTTEHQRVGHGDVVEAVDAGGLEVETRAPRPRPIHPCGRAWQRDVTGPRIPDRGRSSRFRRRGELRSPRMIGSGPDDRPGSVPATLAAVCTLVVSLACDSRASPVRRPPRHSRPPTRVADPAALVHPLDGTGTGPVSPGTVGEFPGADTPFGMIQWSPDTTPERRAVRWRLRLRRLRDQRLQPHPPERHGLPLLSGRPDPAHRWSDRAVPSPEQPCRPSPTRRAATPGRYDVDLDEPGPDRGHARRDHSAPGSPASPSPRHAQANVLFKVADSANPVTAASACTSSATTRSRGRSRAASSVRPGPTTRCTSSRCSTGPSPPPAPGRAQAARRGTRALHRVVVRRLRDVRHRRRSARCS